MNSTFYSRYGKRWLDAITSFIGLLLLSPLLLLIAIAVRLTSPGPAFFSQTRTGWFGEPFRILKFRTMKSTPPGSGPLITAAGDPRITPLGRWLRKTKLDELPQLFNVLVGHMSLVGPRSEVPLYTSRYSEPQKAVFSIRPGITGPSIILNEEELLANQPDRERFYVTTVIPAKLQIDLAYCGGIRFLSDLRLVFLTLSNLFRRPAARSSSPGSIEHLGAISRDATGSST
jgi:lipopolysaccharide/colanic/teichoic acid biosynthesis glycosyltransferase